MHSRLFLALCVALFGLFATQAFAADTCLGISLSTKETVCGGPIPCAYGNYCDDFGKCAPAKAAGEACEDDDECAAGNFCRGVSPNKVCVKIAGVGETCTGDSDLPQPDCASGLYCDFTTKKCFGGVFGDGCTADEQCQGGKCTSGVCDGAAGATCSSIDSCSPANYCDGTTNTCKARLTAGANCFSAECVGTASCTKLSPDLTYLNVTCVAKGTVASGSYCESSEVCESGPCYNSYCLTEPPAYCTNDDTSCNSGDLCLCKGGYLLAGYGKCGKFSCASVFLDYTKCMTDLCGTGSGFSSFSYSNSCPSRNCKGQLDSAIACNPVFFNAFF